LKALMDARVEFKERFVASGKGENGILQWKKRKKYEFGGEGGNHKEEFITN
jgi:hypothetical protein